MEKGKEWVSSLFFVYSLPILEFFFLPATGSIPGSGNILSEDW